MTTLMDPYVLVGTVMAVLAGAILMTRRPQKDDRQKKLNAEMLKIGEQMKMYKQAVTSPRNHTSSTDGLSSSRPRSSSADLTSFPGGRIAILFGSQTGTAEGFAQTLAKEGRKHGFYTFTKDLEKFKYENDLTNSSTNLRAIFVMATYGEGDPTDNAVPFVNFLKNKDKSLEENVSFGNVDFTVFGLGNRQYEHFNATGRLVDKQLEKFGAKRMYNYGEGDDDGSIDEDFEEWKENLWKALKKQFLQAEQADRFPDPNAVSKEEEEGGGGGELKAPDLTYKVKEVKTPRNIADFVPPTMPENQMKNSTKHFFTAENAKIIVNRELRQSNVGGNTIHVEIDLKNTQIKYQTADNLAILPENASQSVERFAQCMEYDLDQWVTIENATEDSNELPFPVPCSIRTILTNYLDINSAPRKASLRLLAYFAVKQDQKAELLKLGSKEAKKEYHEWIIEAERTWVDVVEYFDSVKVNVDYLFDLIPFLLPRYYTISSSNLVNPQRVHATVSVITNSKQDGRIFEGVCSSYLERLQPLEGYADQKKKRDSRPGEQGVKQPRAWPSARMFIRPSTFRLPKDPSTPIIMIGPGTGIAPMRAFLQERAYQKSNGAQVGKSILFFGCRRQNEDFIYHDELIQHQKEGVLSELHLAFSRENPNKKVYVQHLLEQQGPTIWKLLSEQNAYVYVCGATGMGNDVHAVLSKIIQQHGNKTNVDEANKYLKSLQSSHRYIQELWA